MANIKKDAQEQARELYFTTPLRQSDIAQRVGVAERTVSVWVNEGDWRSQKKKQYHAPRVEIQQLYEELRVISQNIARRPPELRFATKEELEARAKTIALIGSMEHVKDQWRNISGDFKLYLPPVPAQQQKTVALPQPQQQQQRTAPETQNSFLEV